MPKTKRKSFSERMATCIHCGSEDVANEGVVEVTRSSANMRAQKVDLYTCLACRRQFERPRGAPPRSAPVEASDPQAPAIPDQDAQTWPLEAAE